MSDLGLANFSLKIEQEPLMFGFRYWVTFSLLRTNGFYSAAGSAPSWAQCVDHVESYIAQVVREAVVE